MLCHKTGKMIKMFKLELFTLKRVAANAEWLGGGLVFSVGLLSFIVGSAAIIRMQPTAPVVSEASLIHSFFTLVALSLLATSITFRRILPTPSIGALRLLLVGIAIWNGCETIFNLYEKPNIFTLFEIIGMLIILLAIMLYSVLIVRQSGTVIRLISELTEQDPMTKLLNRTGLQNSFQSLGSDLPMTVAMIDLAYVQAINQRAGHNAGDNFLMLVAKALKSALPSRSFLARWSGDAFLAVIPDAAEHEARKYIANAHANIQANSVFDYHMATGYFETTSSDALDRIIAVVDARMYDDKRDVLTTMEEPVLTLRNESFTNKLMMMTSADEVISTGLRLARSTLGFDIAHYVERNGKAYFVHASHNPAEVVIEEGTDDAFNSGLASLVLDRRTIVWENDYPHSPYASHHFIEMGVKSIVKAPVFYRNEIVGIFSLLTIQRWQAITPQARNILETVALRLGQVLEHKRALDDVRATLEGGLMGLVAALETRDLETAGHTERVVALSERLAAACGIEGEALEHLRFGAYLHDIGKLAIPDSILLKAGPLTATEWETMKTHSIRGFEIASRIPTLAPATRDVILHHHERFDGTGYPSGLVGEEIPLEARIFSICDVFDALTSERPYKRPWSIEEALTEIAAQAGKQFDPKLVTLFLALEPQVPQHAPPPVSLNGGLTN